MRTDFCGAKLEDIAVEIFRAPLCKALRIEEDISPRRLGIYEVFRGEDDEVRFFFCIKRRKRFLLHDVASPVTEFLLFVDLRTKNFGFDAADLDRLPDTVRDFGVQGRDRRILALDHALQRGENVLERKHPFLDAGEQLVLLNGKPSKLTVGNNGTHIVVTVIFWLLLETACRSDFATA